MPTILPFPGVRSDQQIPGQASLAPWLAPAGQPVRRRRIGLFLPAPYRGGTLRFLKHAALMLWHGAADRGQEIDVVVSCLEGAYDFPQDFQELHKFGIQVRPTRWRSVPAATGVKILRQAGVVPPVSALVQNYSLPSDGHNEFMDCDAWLFISDRVQQPVLPLRPYGVYIADLLHRYVPDSIPENYAATEASTFFPFLRSADFILTTTPVAAGDLNSYVGIPRSKIVQIPMFVDTDFIRQRSPGIGDESYFMWLTNLAPHKNHLRVFQALESYYERGGQVNCKIVGTLTDALRKNGTASATNLSPYAQRVREALHASAALRRHVSIGGELSDFEYQRTLEGARFLLHANLYDNGSFSTVDAACLGVPSLCARYPAQDFINDTFQLNACGFDPQDAESLCTALFEMEVGAGNRTLPTREHLDQFHWRRIAELFYDVLMARFQAPQVSLREAYR